MLCLFWQPRFFRSSLQSSLAGDKVTEPRSGGLIQINEEVDRKVVL